MIFKYCHIAVVSLSQEFSRYHKLQKQGLNSINCADKFNQILKDLKILGDNRNQLREMKS